jgi:hypothetical protein
VRCVHYFSIITLTLVSLLLTSCSVIPKSQEAKRSSTVPASETTFVPTLIPSTAAVTTPTTTTGLTSTRAAAGFNCPITQYPSDQPNFSPEAPPVLGWYGNGRLWAGVVIAYDHWYAGGMKVAWYRITTGTLLVEGRRLDAAAGPLKSDVSTGYGFSGFQSTALDFPTEGCWEVTGKAVDAAVSTVAKEEIRFVVTVLPDASRPANLRWNP